MSCPGKYSIVITYSTEDYFDITKIKTKENQMLYFIAKRWCIFHDVCKVGDVVQVDQVEKYNKENFVEILGKVPSTILLTRGARPASVAAHNLQFVRVKPETSSDDFTMLYMSDFAPQGSKKEKLDAPVFWSIKVTKGTKAVLDILDVKSAAKLYDSLPNKVANRNYIFDAAASKRDAIQQRKEQDAQKKREAEERRARELEEMGPLGRMSEKSDGPAGSLTGKKV
jgi:hypothetical protein